jgi:hypothetical protein
MVATASNRAYHLMAHHHLIDLAIIDHLAGFSANESLSLDAAATRKSQ